MCGEPMTDQRRMLTAAAELAREYGTYWVGAEHLAVIALRHGNLRPVRGRQSSKHTEPRPHMPRVRALARTSFPGTCCRQTAPMPVWSRMRRLLSGGAAHGPPGSRHHSLHWGHSSADDQVIVRNVVGPLVTVAAAAGGELLDICTPMDVMVVRLTPVAVTVHVPEAVETPGPVASTVPAWSTMRIWLVNPLPPVYAAFAVTVADVLVP